MQHIQHLQHLQHCSKKAAANLQQPEPFYLPVSLCSCAAFFFFSLCSLIIGTTLMIISTAVIIRIISVDKALIDGFTRLLMVYTRIEMLLTPLPVTK